MNHSFAQQTHELISALDNQTDDIVLKIEKDLNFLSEQNKIMIKQNEQIIEQNKFLISALEGK